MLEQGGIPQGDYAPAPWLLSSAGYAVWLETDGTGAASSSDPSRIAVSTRSAAGPLRLHLFTDPTPAARLRSLPARSRASRRCCPNGATATGRAATSTSTSRRRGGRFRGLPRALVPLDAIVIDSPWETQYNTWEFNPHQFPDARGLMRRMRARGVRTVSGSRPG